MKHHKDATKDWIKQRLSAVAIIAGIFCFNLIFFGYNNKNIAIIENANLVFPFIAINLICIYHGTLGMHVIIEDYVHSQSLRNLLIWIINIIAMVTIILSLIILPFLFLGAMFFGMSFLCFTVGVIATIFFFYLLLKS